MEMLATITAFALISPMILGIVYSIAVCWVLVKEYIKS